MDRLGNATPTQSLFLPYQNSFGDDVVSIYNKSRKSLMPWQIDLIKPMLAINDDGLFTHQKFGIAISRRNGKSELLVPVMVWAMEQGLQVMYTAHRSLTSRSVWERLNKFLLEIGYDDDDLKIGKQVGMESIMLKDTEGRTAFRTRTTKGGMGEGYDILIIDEAQEYTTDQEAAIKYVVSDAPNPLTIMIGTPPTPMSSGTVFSDYRTAVLKGELPDSGWAEWSVEQLTDPHDREAWYLTNPSMGVVLTERKVLAEISGDDLDFNIQRLGYWVKYNIKSAISEAEWDELLYKPTKTELTEDACIGVKFGKDGTNVAVGVALKLTDERIFVEVLDCRPIRDGTDWIINLIKGIQPKEVVIDGAIGQKILEEQINALKLSKPVLPTVKEIITGYAKFEQGITNKTLCHAGQPSLRAVVSNCDKRPIGSNGGFGYQSIKDGLDIVLLDAVMLAHWSRDALKVRKKQQVFY